MRVSAHRRAGGRRLGGLGGEGADVVDLVPALIFGELVLPGRHGGAGDAVGDPVEELGVGVAGGHVDAQVGRGRAQGGGGRAVAAAGVAVADGAIGVVDLFAGGERGGGGRE